MAIIILLISISLCIAVGFLIAFLWSLKSGQYDDTYSPAVRILFETGSGKPGGAVDVPQAEKKKITDSVTPHPVEQVDKSHPAS